MELAPSRIRWTSFTVIGEVVFRSEPDCFCTFQRFEDELRGLESVSMIRRIWKLTQTSFVIWGRANSSRMAAALTFFTVLSLAPLLVMAIGIAGFVYGDQVAEQEVIELVSQFTSEEIATITGGLIKNATSQPESGLIASTISLVILVFAASGVFSQLHDTFNEIWYVPIEDRSGWFFLIRTRIVGIALVFIAGVLLLATIVLSTGLETFGTWWAEYYPKIVPWIHVVDKSVAFLLTPLVLSLFFWFLPVTKVEWRDVWPAGLLTAALIGLSRFLIGFYLRFSSTSEAYGAAGSLVVLLIWVYITGMVIFYGAAFSHAYAQVFGSRSGDQTPEVSL